MAFLNGYIFILQGTLQSIRDELQKFLTVIKYKEFSTFILKHTLLQ